MGTRNLAAALTVLMLVAACSEPAPASPSGADASAIPAVTSDATLSALVPQIIEAIAIDASGRLYGSDCFRNTVFRFDDGLPVVVAGNGTSGLAGDGGPGIGAALSCPSGLAFTGTDLYIVDDGNSQVRKLNREGIIDSVASSRPLGTSRGSPYPGGLQAAGMAIDAQGSIYIADRDNHVVRRIDAQGTITTFAGNGSRGFAGDGGPALEASFAVPIDVVADPHGNIYVSDLGNNRVRRIDPHGTITTFAGTGDPSATGDGEAAVHATLCGPSGLALDGTGSLYVAGDCGTSGHHIRRIDATGIITTVVGKGTAGYAGNGGPALEAEIRIPSGLEVDAEGNLYIADVGNRCIRIADAAGIIRSLWCA